MKKQHFLSILTLSSVLFSNILQVQSSDILGSTYPIPAFPELSVPSPKKDTPALTDSSDLINLPSLQDFIALQRKVPQSVCSADSRAQQRIPVNGKSLNQEKSLWDLDYPFRKNGTGQMLVSFAGQLLVIVPDKGKTSLYLYDPLKNKVLKKASFDFSVYLDSRMIIASGNGRLILYDNTAKSFICVDSELKECKRTAVPENVRGLPLISGDMSYLYYFSSDGQLLEYSTEDLSSRSLDYGLIPDQTASLGSLILDNRFLTVSGKSKEGENADTTVLINLTEGRPKKSFKGIVRLGSDASSVFTLCTSGLTQSLFTETDTPDGTPLTRELIPQDALEYQSMVFDAPNRLVLTAASTTDISSPDFGKTSLQIYDLKKGKRRSQTDLSLLFDKNTFAGEVENLVYLPGLNMAAFQFRHDYSHIVLWDLNASPLKGKAAEKSLFPYYPPGSPDLEGIRSLKEQTGILGHRYGVSVLIAEECIRDFTGYQTSPVYTTRVIQESLRILEKAFKAYPTGFLKQLETDGAGPLKFYLTGAITPTEAWSTRNTGGFYFHENQEQSLILDITRQSSLEDTVYHEISHSIDQFAKTKGMEAGFVSYQDDIWNQLNPEGFSYDYSYQASGTSAQREFCPPQKDPESIYFTDTYSRSFPSEDRAQIMQHAMNPGRGMDYFSCPPIHRKLQYMSEALRTLFNTDGWDTVTTWEKPLDP